MAMNSISLYFHLHHSLSRFYKEQAPSLPSSVLEGDIPGNAFPRTPSKVQAHDLPPTSVATDSRTNSKNRSADREVTHATQNIIQKRADGRLPMSSVATASNNEGTSPNTHISEGNGKAPRGKAKQNTVTEDRQGHDFEPYIWGLY
ncbi:hypothetical protein GLAREA_01785 [Glarea lozoyensis ATCC 20868]|uniref:Uncharacterized protein n=1 Tax=Glarea lozoyensis (strain ATCC 20868 / MF5171) TaxID=1116229 RepID=S3DH23_GLAL2|nr:uncharacterized protein GLAREA_01785 [Glarea lozoyensis ATCC 20868]EPE25873.1 hypothetical protein GLAREA_01785 [Glarea lozoyensis ATCC 20868]